MTSISSQRPVERLFVAGLALCGVAASLTIVAVVGITAVEAMPALGTAGPIAFLTDDGWFPLSSRFGLMPMVTGTVLVSLGALALAGPMGIVSAVFCNHYAPAGIAAAYRLMLKALAGIPSVVYGLWGLVTLVPLIAAFAPPGASLLAGILVLALMILPTVAVVADSAIQQLPPALYRGGAALGMSRHTVAFRVVVPAARSGLTTALVLALGRALGETMALLMVTGNLVQYPSSLFDPVRTLAANIALEMAYAQDIHRSALFVSGLILALLVAAALVVAEVTAPDGARHVD